MYKYTIETYNIKNVSCCWHVLQITDMMNIILKASTEEEAIEKAKELIKRDKYEIKGIEDLT